MEGFTFTAILLTTVLLDGTADGNAEIGRQKDYCQNEVFKAKCGPNEVIQMTSASYGRMDLSRCVKKDYGYIGCGNDVMSIAHALCSGRHQCEIPIPNGMLDRKPPCPEDFKSYLSATYKCIKVMQPDGHRCSASTFVELTTPEGVIGSVVTNETDCGSYRSPWLIHALPGQRVNISLVDFALDEESYPEPDACVAYATVREEGTRNSVTICARRKLEQHVYTSESHMVEIKIQGSPKNQRYFLLKYKVFGCPQVTRPANGWIIREGDVITAGCNTSGHTWTLNCRNDHWYGNPHNCTPVTSSLTQWPGLSISFGLSMAIVILIALAIAGCILLAGLVYLQKKRQEARLRKLAAPGYVEKQTSVESRKYYECSNTTGRSYWSSRDPVTGENEYASIPDNLSPSVGTGNEDGLRQLAGLQHMSYTEQRRLQQQHGYPVKCNSMGGSIHDPADPREYFVLVPDDPPYQAAALPPIKLIPMDR